MNRKNRIAIALAVSTLAILTGCGKGNDSVVGIPGSLYGPGGSICATGAASQVPFVITNGLATSLTLKAGNIPSSQWGPAVSAGTMSIGGGGTGPYTDSGVDGQLTMNIQAVTSGLGMYQVPVNAQGVVTINPATQQDIMYQSGGLMGMYQPYGSSVNCASITGVAMMTNFQGGYQLYGTKVFLYLNNSSHGYILNL